MKFKEKLALLRRKTESREIQGQTFTFHPISVGMLFELRTSMKPLMKGLKALFSKQEAAGSQTVEETRDPMTGAVLGRVTHLGAPSLEMAEFHQAKADKDITEAIDAVLGEDNRVLLGRVLADSLRDLFDGKPADEEVEAFIADEAMDLPTLVELLQGFFQVNSKVFGPFAERVRDLVKTRMSDLAPGQEPDESSEPESSEPESQPTNFRGEEPGQ